MAELFESNWSATKDALLEGLNGSKKSTLDVVLENTKRYLQESASSGATQAGNVATSVSYTHLTLPTILLV